MISYLRESSVELRLDSPCPSTLFLLEVYVHQGGPGLLGGLDSTTWRLSRQRFLSCLKAEESFDSQREAVVLAAVRFLLGDLKVESLVATLVASFVDSRSDDGCTIRTSVSAYDYLTVKMPSELTTNK